MSQQRSFAGGLSRASVSAPAERNTNTVEKGSASTDDARSICVSLSASSSAKSTAGTLVTRGQARKSTVAEVPTDAASYKKFRGLCDRIIEELQNIPRFLHGDVVTDEGAEVVAEVEALLEELYDCPHGQGEALKRVVVAIQSQVNNVQWEKTHADFLMEVFTFLRVRYLIDESVVAACYDTMKEHGLDPFRGSVAESLVVKRYRIEEIATK
jgi:hypothetical protein